MNAPLETEGVIPELLAPTLQDLVLAPSALLDLSPRLVTLPVSTSTNAPRFSPATPALSAVTLLVHLAAQHALRDSMALDKRLARISMSA